MSLRKPIWRTGSAWEPPSTASTLGCCPAVQLCGVRPRRGRRICSHRSTVSTPWESSWRFLCACVRGHVYGAFEADSRGTDDDGQARGAVRALDDCVVGEQSQQRRGDQDAACGSVSLESPANHRVKRRNLGWASATMVGSNPDALISVALGVGCPLNQAVSAARDIAAITGSKKFCSRSGNWVITAGNSVFVLLCFCCRLTGCYQRVGSIPFL